MSTQCYAMVRGSALRVTALGSTGRVPDEINYVVSRSVIRVRVNEVIDAPASEIMSTPQEEKRIRLHRTSRTIRYTVDIDFIRVDPELLAMLTSALVVREAASSESLGFGEMPFGEGPFGEGTEAGAAGDARGFDSTSRAVPTSFALEVWTKIAGQACADGSPLWGYTVFPLLRGGRLSNVTFANGLVSFNMIGAQTRRYSDWGVGPYDLEGPFERLVDAVSGNLSWRNMLTRATPPAQTDGVQVTADFVDNGTPANPMPDLDALLFIDGGTPADAGAYAIDGGRP